MKLNFFTFKIYVLLCIPITIPIIILIKLLEKIVIIRFLEIQVDRIGHLSGQMELLFLQSKESQEKSCIRILDVYYSMGKVANRTLLSLWKGKVIVVNKYFIYPIAYLCFKFLNDSHKCELICGDKDIMHLLDKHPVSLTLPEDMLIKGDYNLCQQLKIPSGAKIVCLNIRDSAYYGANSLDNSVTSYRNTIELVNFIEAIKYLINKGFYVIRMGRDVEKKFPLKDDMFIDYANSNFSSDFMDIFLANKCEFFISTLTGWDSVPYYSFRKCGVFVNSVPTLYMQTYRDKVFYLAKKHFLKGTSKELGLEEICSNNVGYAFSTDDFSENQVELEENSSKDILNIVMDLHRFIDSGCKEDGINMELQNKFRRKFLQLSVKYSHLKRDDEYKNTPYHNEIRGYYAPTFLEDNLWWLES
mgnify:FL=1|jgi:putative glycosyltransferase (TIGR04372 family)